MAVPCLRSPLLLFCYFTLHLRGEEKNEKNELGSGLGLGLGLGLGYGGMSPMGVLPCVAFRTFCFVCAFLCYFTLLLAWRREE